MQSRSRVRITEVVGAIAGTEITGTPEGYLDIGVNVNNYVYEVIKHNVPDTRTLQKEDYS